MRALPLILLLSAWLPLAAQEVPAFSVGMAGTMKNVVLPGSELEAIPEGLEGKLVLRITEKRPHGNAFRYSFSWYGLEVGEHDLKDFLRRRDGSSTADLPALPVRVLSVLPEGKEKPSEPTAAGALGVGGYRRWLWIAGGLWVVGLFAILFVGRRPKDEAGVERTPEATLEARLRPLVEGALIRTLDEKGRAELELLLIEFWRKRLSLGDRSQREVLSILKEHEEAGPLIRKLEEWLHRPPLHEEEVDLPRLLLPYRDVADPTAQKEAQAWSS